MTENITRQVDMKELEKLSLVGGSDGDPPITPYSSITFSCITATLTVSLISVTTVSAALSMSTDTFC